MIEILIIGDNRTTLISREEELQTIVPMEDFSIEIQPHEVITSSKIKGFFPVFLRVKTMSNFCPIKIG